MTAHEVINSISPKRGNTWSAHVVGGMLKNEKYIGDVLLGKTYTDSQFNRHINHGERDMYYIENHHPAIVSKEDFESANKLFEFNCKEKNIETGSGKCLKRYALSGNVFCGECGSKWKRQMRNGVPCYVCDRHIRDSSFCGQKAVREDFIQAAFMTMMNKLTFAKKEILYLLGKHGGENSAAVYDRINLLQDELKSVIARRESIQTFLPKGFSIRQYIGKNWMRLRRRSAGSLRKRTALQGVSQIITIRRSQLQNSSHMPEKV